jgi:hypothetical protein
MPDAGRTPLPRAWKLGKHHRAALLAGLAILATAQLGLLGVLECGPPGLRDPEYGTKLARLRARLAERTNRGPLAVFLGSSRVGCGVRPEVLPASTWDGAEPVPMVFNFALTRSGPLWELLCLRRMLADGIRPDWVLVEVWPPLVCAEVGEHEAEADRTDLQRLRWRDLEVVGRYHPQPRALYRDWAQAQLAPWYAHRFLLRNQYAPSWLPPERRCDAGWVGIQEGGWLEIPQYGAGEEGWRARHEPVRKAYAGTFDHFRPSEVSEAALRELLAVCRRERIQATLLLLPDGMRSCCLPAARAQQDAFLQRLSRECAVDAIDLRDWLREPEFFDAVHLNHQSAAAFTRQLGREVLRPLLAGRGIPAAYRLLGSTASASRPAAPQERGQDQGHGAEAARP